MVCFDLLFLLVSVTLILHFQLNKAQPNNSKTYYVWHFCLGKNFTEKSAFQNNLGDLLSSISNYDSPNITQFYNNSVGSDPDRVYGFFQCKGDASMELCKMCAVSVTQTIPTRCPYAKESFVMYDKCLVHYSDKSFVSKLQLYPVTHMINTATEPDPLWPHEKLVDFMEELVSRAISHPTYFFATGEQTFPPFQTIYGLVQCTQNMSARDCKICFRQSLSEIPTCCANRSGARVIRPSCSLRYEAYNFLDSPDTPSPAGIIKAGHGKRSSQRVVSVVASIVSVLGVLSILLLWFRLRKSNIHETDDGFEEMGSEESLQFNYRSVRDATNNFSDNNMLGKGGFGIVYKGILLDGREIAVKRLSRDSGQGVDEFKNEVLLIVKLQHRNLVKLLGFCLKGYEKLLIYEFASNASLDHYIFDQIKRTQLNWERRYKIIGGIARGLLYLHEDSRHRIIHRDLKVGNILLDAQMEPKISDFGMARLFGMDQTEGSTRKVVGTYGYMAPEYAMYGQFSVKSDVFSFGVLVLEIITGQKNSHSQDAEDLLSHAWRHWEQGTALKLIEPALKENYSKDEVMRCIHIGLLCVQEDVALRPTMTTVVQMLNRDSVALPLPSTPAFFVNASEKVNTAEHGKDPLEETESMDISITHSISKVSMTELHAR